VKENGTLQEVLCHFLIDNQNPWCENKYSLQSIAGSLFQISAQVFLKVSLKILLEEWGTHAYVFLCCPSKVFKTPA
jgi:hypothetical protein